MVEFSLLNPERRMLRALQAGERASWTLNDLLAACDWTDQVVAVGAGHGLENRGLVTVETTVVAEVVLDSSGQDAVDRGLLKHGCGRGCKAKRNRP